MPYELPNKPDVQVDWVLFILTQLTTFSLIFDLYVWPMDMNKAGESLEKRGTEQRGAKIGTTIIA